jgi:hypothetical protein
MREKFHRFLPLVIAAAMVAGLGAAPVAAQSDDPVAPAAVSGNADQVDYKDAVGAKTSRAERAKSLVATNREGRLPSNILEPLWKLIKGIPAVLADGQISWAELVAIPAVLADGQVGWGEVDNKPAGFADGTDDVGYTSTTQPTTYDATTTVWAYAEVPLGVDVELTIIPAAGGSMLAWPYITERGPLATSPLDPALPALPAGTMRRIYLVSPIDVLSTYKVRTRVYNTGIAPAAFKKAAKQVEVGVVKVSKRTAKELRQRFGW